MPKLLTQKSLLVFYCLVAAIGVYAQAPTNNPVAAFYNNEHGYPAWTDRIQWQNVIDMSTYANGANNFEKFENARDLLHSQGGGVLYYPAGTYDFSDMPADGPDGRGLMLKSGVVIRGATPNIDADAKDGTLELPTKFQFKFRPKPGGEIPRDWNFIGIIPAAREELKDVHDVGIAWVHTIGATVFFGAQYDFQRTWGTASATESRVVKTPWRSRVCDGTYPLDAYLGKPTKVTGLGNGRLVFGCYLQDAVLSNDILDQTRSDSLLFPQANQIENPDFFSTHRRGGRISVYGTEIFVANNVLPKSNKNFKYTQLTCNAIQQQSVCEKMCKQTRESLVLFDYAKQAGIDINKGLFASVGFGGPAYFTKAAIVQDNYVYNHGHKGFDISGTWVIIRNNHNVRDIQKEGDDVYGIGPGWEMTMDGYLESLAGGHGCYSDNLSRAFDLGGQALWIDNNYLNNVGSNPGNDGEAILCQSWGGTELYSWAITNNIHEQGSGQRGYMGGWDVHQYGSLIAWNKTPGWVGSTKVSNRTVLDAAFVGNEAAEGAKAEPTSDALIECPVGIINPPVNVQAVAVPDSDYVHITWEDATENEIGFRVDRKIGTNGTWTPIVYRPRRSLGSLRNEQAWRDYLAPNGKELFYRVAAINCSNSSNAVTEATTKVVLNVPTALAPNQTGSLYTMQVLPNPAKEHITVQVTVKQSQPIRLSLIDVLGKPVSQLYVGTVDANMPYTFTLPTQTLPNGIYFVRMDGQNIAVSKRIVVLK